MSAAQVGKSLLGLVIIAHAVACAPQAGLPCAAHGQDSEAVLRREVGAADCHDACP